jgi:hypothetical protein
VARDLIPPPSPAGRPEGDWEKGDRDETPFSHSSLLRTDAEHQAAVEATTPIEPAGPSKYRSRFGFILGALVGVGVAAMVIIALVITGDDSVRQQPWSAWKPSHKDPDVAAVEIAQHVAHEYRQDSGDQLVDVYAQRLEIGSTPLNVVIRSTGKGEGADIIDIPGKSLLFVLKGLGPNGSIDTGEPSAKRLRLIQREAYELSLYAFKYVKGIDNVVAFLPPAPPSPQDKAADQADAAANPLAPSKTDGRLSSGELAASLAKDNGVNSMLFLPGDVAASLQRPLADTFPDAQPPRPSTLTDAEEATFGAFAQVHAFSASVVPDQTGAGFLLLDRAAASSAVQDALRSKLKA